MKKQLTFATFLILAAGVLFSALHQEEHPSMKLVNVKSGFVVVEFSKGETHFGDRFLEAEMRKAGILIPQAKRAEFGGKDSVLLGDPLFQKAFVEIYVPLNIASSTYSWEQ